MFSRHILIFALFCTTSVLSKHVLTPCDLHDNKCLTVAAARNFVEVMSGMPGVPTSDPLHLDLIEVNLPTINYKLTDASLSGMKSCHMENLQFNPEAKKYHAHYACLHLVIEAQYEAKGNLGPEHVEGSGTCRFDYYDYNFHFNGEYRRMNCSSDSKIHIQLKNHNVEIEAKGKVHYALTNLFDNDKIKSAAAHKFANENYQFVDKILRQPTFEAFMRKHFDNVNAFFRKVPVRDVFSY